MNKPRVTGTVLVPTTILADSLRTVDTIKDHSDHGNHPGKSPSKFAHPSLAIKRKILFLSTSSGGLISPASQDPVQENSICPQEA